MSHIGHTSHTRYPYVTPSAVPVSQPEPDAFSATFLALMNDGLEDSPYRYVIDNTGQVRLLLNHLSDLHDSW